MPIVQAASCKESFTVDISSGVRASDNRDTETIPLPPDRTGGKGESMTLVKQ
jgi:hypothetical protein